MSWVGMTAIVAVIGATGDHHNQTWPSVRLGTWHIEGTLSVPGRKTRTWKEDATQCTNPIFLFQGYWGDGIVERDGCRFESARSADGTYLIVGECSVRGRGHSRSQSRVTINSETSFTIETILREGRRNRKVSQTGTWTAPCPERNEP